MPGLQVAAENFSFGEAVKRGVCVSPPADSGAEPTGPSSWDGYAATVITDAAVKSLESGGQIIAVDMKPRPACYGATS